MGAAAGGGVPYYASPSGDVVLYRGDATAVLRALPAGSVHTCITSPPYWNLRDYSAEGQIGMEATPAEYVAAIVAVFDQVRRVLRDDGTLWLNLGDSYASDTKWGGSTAGKHARGLHGCDFIGRNRTQTGLAGKNLVGIPWRVVFALQDAGWILRSDIIWSKPNPMPESVGDRPTRSHEYVFLLSKGPRYFFDQEAVMQAVTGGTHSRGDKKSPPKTLQHEDSSAKVKNNRSFMEATWGAVSARNVRSVWEIATEPYPGAHFACVDDETEALTPTGWKRHDELGDGDIIAAYDRECGLVAWQTATFHRYDYDGELVTIEKRDASQRLTPNHRCLVRRGARGAAVVVEAGALRPGMEVMTTAQWWVPVEESVGGAAWAALLGWYIAEGHNRAPGRVGLYQSLSANPQHCDTIRALLRVCEAEYRERVREREWRGRPSVEIEWVVWGEVASRLQGFAPTKRMRPGLAMLPSHEAHALLDALIAADGHRRADGRACIVQKDKGCIEAMQMLALRLGYRAHVSRRPDGGYMLYLTEGKWLTLRGSNGKHTPIPRERYEGTVWCPSVPAGFWLARRDGKPFITGNTFPTKLVEPCLLAGTSARGCCPACGAPWTRMTEASYTPHPAGGHVGFAARGDADGMKDLSAMPRLTKHVETTGWRAGCACAEAGDPIPAVVLDPFAGACTTGLVARKHGRSFIGIELSEAYCRMARERLGQLALPGWSGAAAGG
jgi:DNA modification methylase